MWSRKDVRKPIALLLVLVLASSITLTFFPIYAVSSGDDWPMFHHDPSHTGAGTGSPALVPTLLWKYTTNPPITPSRDYPTLTSPLLESSPAVVDGVVYVGSGDNTYALNATDGTELWSYTTGGIVESSPAVVNGVVYVGSDDGNVYALGSPTPSPTKPFPTLLVVAISVAVVAVAGVGLLVYLKKRKHEV
jgi:outer membrane protein assembly factor BamB